MGIKDGGEPDFEKLKKYLKSLPSLKPKDKDNKDPSPLRPKDSTETENTVCCTFSKYNKARKEDFEKEMKKGNENEIKSITGNIKELLLRNPDFETLKTLFKKLDSVKNEKLESLKSGSTWSVKNLIDFIPQFKINVNYNNMELNHESTIKKPFQNPVRPAF